MSHLPVLGSAGQPSTAVVMNVESDAAQERRKQANDKLRNESTEL